MANPNIKQKARECFQRGQLKKAQALYEKLCRADANDVEALYMLGSTHGQRGQYRQACEILEQALSKQPNALPIHCALGAAYKSMGNKDQAIARFRQAHALSPDNTDIGLELAGLLMTQGEYSEARGLLESILSKPGSQGSALATALHGLGELAQLERKTDTAIEYYRHALQAEPDRPMTHNRLGYALHTQGHLDEAIRHYRRATELAPDLFIAHKNLASTLTTAGRLEAALDSVNRALALEPDDVAAVSCKASILERRNEHQAAYDLIKPLIDRGVRHPGLGVTLAEICRKIGVCEETAEYLETLLQKLDLPDSTREQLHYAAGKLYDQLDAFDTAFGHFQAANALRPDHYASAEHWATIHILTETFSRDFLKTAPRAQHGSRQPVFILGMPRSGTSLTEQILACHPEVAAAGELLEIEHQAKFICAATSGMEMFPQCLQQVTDQLVETAAGNYLQRLGEIASQARCITDKMPQNFLFLGLINLLFPQARVIHCTRDPRDVCLSIYFQHFNESHTYATRLEHIADYYQAYRRLMEHWKNTLDIPILDVRYETLISDQEPTTRRLLEFLDLEWDPRCLQFHKSERHVATSSYDQVRQPLYSRSAGRWRQYREHIAPLLEVFGDEDTL